MIYSNQVAELLRIEQFKPSQPAPPLISFLRDYQLNPIVFLLWVPFVVRLVEIFAHELINSHSAISLKQNHLQHFPVEIQIRTVPPPVAIE